MLNFATLLESLRSPYPWRVSEQNRSMYEVMFLTDARVKYVITFSKSSSVLNKYSIWDVEFSLVGAPYKSSNSFPEYNVTGAGDAFQVFATVIDVLRAFVKRYDPQTIQFSATEPSRIKLYSRLVNMVASELPGYYGARETDGHNFFIKRKTPLGGSLNPIRPKS